MNIKARLLALAAFAGTLRAQTNLLLNPSFEAGSFVNSGNGFMTLANGDTSLANWSVLYEVTISWGTTPNSTNLVASAGTKFLNLTGFHAPVWSGVSQTVTLNSGIVYRLAFDLGTEQNYPTLAGPVTLEIDAGTDLYMNVPWDPVGPFTQWGRFAVDFTASATGPVPIMFVGVGGNRCIALDNVALTPLPPATRRRTGVDTATWVPAGSNTFTTLSAVSVRGQSLAVAGTGVNGQLGIYRFPIPGPGVPPGPRRIADTATAIPNGTGNFTAFAPVGFPPGPLISGNNVAFYGEGASGQKGVYVALGTNVARVADTTTAIPSGAGNFTAFAPVGYPPVPILSGNNVAFWGQGASSQGLYARLNGALTRVADTATSIPNGTGNFTSFTPTPVADGNIVALIGSGSGGQQGVYYFDEDGLEMIVDTTAAIPGGTGNFTSFTGALALPSPQSPPHPVFVGSGSGGQQGVYVAVPPSPVFTAKPHKIADKTTAIPGGTGLFTGFGAVSIDAGVAAFIGTGSGSQSGLYALRAGSLQKVVAVGDVVDSKTVSAVALAPVGLSGTTLAYTLSFSDSSQAVFTESLPTSVDDFHITAVTRLAQHLGLSHTTQPGFQYVVLANSNLVSGTWSATPGTNTGTGFVIDTVVSNAFSSATTQQFYRVECVPGSYASDSAVDVAYSGNWTDGSNGGVGFGPWVLTATGVIDSGSNGYFVSASTGNALVGGPGIDVGGQSWGIYANSGNNTAAYRDFAGHALAVGQSVRLDMDTGFIDGGGSDGFVLRHGNASGSPSDFNVGMRFEFLFTGGGSNYQVMDLTGSHNLGVPFTGTGKHLVFTLTGANSYTLLTIDNAGGTTNTFSGTLAGSGTVDSLAVFNRNAGTTSVNDCFFNSLQILSP